VDDYCCENEWDEICQLTYNHCELGWPMPDARITENEIIIYPNPTKDIINIAGNEFSINIYNAIGELIISEENPSIIDLSIYSAGMYTLQILYKNNIITKQIIKN
jgi:hypothetical protein